MRTTGYDESGQVYTETTCASGPMTVDWVWETKGSPQEQGHYRAPGRGSSSLSEMVIRSFLKHSQSLTADSLEDLPWELGRLLWQKAVQSRLDSIKVWKAFAIAYPNTKEEKSLCRRTKIITHPNMPLPSYFEPVTSTTFQWLTVLSLQHIGCPRSSLLQISRITNLAVLSIGEGVYAPAIGVDDALVRSWARSAATDPSAFTMLRVMTLRSRPYITSRIFEYLGGFPVLAVVSLEIGNTGRREEHIAESEGWECSSSRGVGLLNSKWGAIAAEWEAIVDASLKLGEEHDVEKTTGHGLGPIGDLPRLHLDLGGAGHYATVGVEASGAMRYFFRVSSLGRRKGRDTSDAAIKTLIPELSSSARNSVLAKKRKIRQSKQQDMADSLREVGL